MRSPRSAYVKTWSALLVLLALTCASAFVPLGGFNTALNFVIALAKALLVVFVFMHIRAGGAMIRIVAIAGVVWLSLLVGLSLFDFAFR